MAYTYDIVEHIGVLDRNQIGWTKEVNMVAWKGIHDTPMVDIREWSSNKSRMGRGITLTPEQAQHLAVLLLERLGSSGESV